jgi:hypothetical protein
MISDQTYVNLKDHNAIYGPTSNTKGKFDNI